MILCFVGSSIYFLLARSGRKTDGHIIHTYVYYVFYVFFLHRQGLNRPLFFGIHMEVLYAERERIQNRFTVCMLKTPPPIQGKDVDQVIRNPIPCQRPQTKGYPEISKLRGYHMCVSFGR